MKQSTMKPQAAIREEELKNRIAALFFGKYKSVGPGPGADFIFSAISPCFAKISAARRGST